MAVLNSWQKIDRVLPGQPFGNGSDGAYSSATIPTLTKDSCSGSATSTTLTTAGSTFANGDILLIHQTRGTGAGQWEINKVASGGGSTSLTLSVALNYTYTDSGASQAQAIKIPQYSDITLPSGTWDVPAWDGNVGGILALAGNGIITLSSTLNADGNDGQTLTSGNPSGGSGRGFSGGNGEVTTNYTVTANAGEGTSGASVSDTTSANGSGGGGGSIPSAKAAKGGGGGNGVGGATGSADAGATGGTGGGTSGAADLTTITFGGGGGGGAKDSVNSCSGGGGGAGIVMLFVKDVATITGDVSLDGGSGGTHGGGGAGGSCLIVCQTATLGTTKITALGNLTDTDAGDGRIAVHHSGTVTGTTNPTFTDVLDNTLVTGGTLDLTSKMW